MTLTDELLLSVSQATTPDLTFSEDLALCREVGAPGIGIQQRDKLVDPVDDLARFRDSGLVATVCIPQFTSVLPSARSGVPLDPADRIELISRALEVLAPYEPACCICGPGPIGDYEPEQAWGLAVDGLRTLARRAADLGITLGIEPLHTSLRSEWSCINTLPEARALCDDIGAPNVGIMVDFWHLSDTPDVLSHLRANADRVVGVQVDDRPAVIRTWADRVLPGAGVGAVGEMVQALKAAGYRGWFDLEILSDDGRLGTDLPDSLWRRDPAEMVAEGLDRMRALWA